MEPVQNNLSKEACGDAPSPDVRIGAGAAHTFAAKIFVAICGFGVSILLARVLGPSAKGTISILQQIASILAMVLNLGLGSAFIYYVGTGRHSIGSTLGNSIAVLALLSLISIPAAYLFTTGPAAVTSGLTVAAALVVSLSVALSISTGFLRGILIGLGRLRGVARSQGAIAGAGLAVIAVGMALGAVGLADDLSAVSAFMLMTLAGTVGLIMNLGEILSLKKPGDRVRTDWGELRESRGYSLKASVAGIAAYQNNRIDIILLGYLSTTAAAGVYTIAVTLTELLWYLPSALATSITAKSLTKTIKESASYTALTCRMSLLLMVVAAAVLALAATPFITLVYGTAFVGATKALLLLLPGTICMGVSQIQTGFLNARGIQMPKIFAFVAAVNIIANIILIPQMGFSGAALASTISYAISVVLISARFMRETELEPQAFLFPRRSDLRTLLESIKSYQRGKTN